MDECYYVDEIPEILIKFQVKTLHILHGVNSDSKATHAGAVFTGIEAFDIDKTALYSVLSECRVHKTALELELMRYVVQKSAEAHKAVMQAVRISQLSLCAQLL